MISRKPLNRTGTLPTVLVLNNWVQLYRQSQRKRPICPLRKKLNQLLPGSTTNSNLFKPQKPLHLPYSLNSSQTFTIHFFRSIHSFSIQSFHFRLSNTIYFVSHSLPSGPIPHTSKSIICHTFSQYNQSCYLFPNMLFIYSCAISCLNNSINYISCYNVLFYSMAYQAMFNKIYDLKVYSTKINLISLLRKEIAL